MTLLLRRWIHPRLCKLKIEDAWESSYGRHRKRLKWLSSDRLESCEFMGFDDGGRFPLPQQLLEIFLVQGGGAFRVRSHCTLCWKEGKLQEICVESGSQAVHTKSSAPFSHQSMRLEDRSGRFWITSPGSCEGRKGPGSRSSAGCWRPYCAGYVSALSQLSCNLPAHEHERFLRRGWSWTREPPSCRCTLLSGCPIRPKAVHDALGVHPEFHLRDQHSHDRKSGEDTQGKTRSGRGGPRKQGAERLESPRRRSVLAQIRGCKPAAKVHRHDCGSPQ